MADEWDRHRSTIYRLYVLEDKGLAEVMRQLKENHGFQRGYVTNAWVLEITCTNATSAKLSMRRNSEIGDSPKTVEALTGSLYTTRFKRERNRKKTSQAWFIEKGEESMQRSSTRRVDTIIPACWSCSIRQVLKSPLAQHL
jgi:hypothetical protein